MKITQTALICIASFSLVQTSVYAEEGKEMHEENCVRCHSVDLYAHNNRKVKDLPGLGKQVRFCKDNLGVTWFDEDVDLVIDYLNKSYYKF